jgi:tetratricopeptide (TPR) repeat protein
MRLRLADGFNLLGREEDAAAIYKELMAELPYVPTVRDNLRARLAEIYLRNPADHQRAGEHLEGMLRDNPTDPQIYLLLGAIAMETTNYAQASDHFSKAILLNPNLESAYHQLARAQLADEKTAAALITLENGRKRFPANFMMEYLSGLAYSHAEDYTNAVKYFTSAEVVGRATDARRLDQLYFFFFEFGAALERKGDYAAAEKYFEKCLELSPNYAAAQNYLGYMLAEQGIKLDRARELIARALTAEPENAAYLDSMGWVLFKMNQPKEALDYLLQAIRHSDEEDAVLYDHLGDIYSALNQPEQALEAWRKSLSLDPKDTVRRKVEPVSAR